jgi:phosphatidylglycerol:prolipoprotein diacylglycerol transferase
MNPVIGYIGILPVNSYFFFTLIGSVSGFIILYINTGNLGKNTRLKTFLLAALCFITTMTGARAGAVLESCILRGSPPQGPLLSFFGENSIWGGLLFGSACLFPLARLLKLKVMETFDLYIISASLGAMFVRLGCFFNGCCFGIPCPEKTAGVFFPSFSPAGEIFPNTYLYPVQIYESLAWLVIFVYTGFLKRKKHFHGQLIITAGIMYSLFRFFIEFYRFHETKMFLSAAQVYSIFSFSAGVILFFYLRKTRKTA